MAEYDYTQTEWNKRKDLLKRAGVSLQQYMERHSRYASTSLLHSETLSHRWEIRPKMVSADQWERVYYDIAAQAPGIASRTSTDPDGLGGRSMRCWVSGNPVFRWQAHGSMLNVHSGQLAHGANLRNIVVIFSFPYTPAR